MRTVNKRLFIGLVSLMLSHAAQATVVINEVCYDPSGVDTGKEWIELKNIGSNPLTITGYDLNASSGDYYTFPSLTVPAGNYVVVHWRTDGTNDTDFSDDVAHLYTGSSGIDDNMGNTSGWVALFNSTTHSSSTIVDYMEYGAGGNTWESAAVSAGIWTEGDYASDVAESHSLEYDGSGDAGSDWFDQSVPTQGEDNSLPVTMSSLSAEVSGGAVVVRWVTESEVGTLGFHVWRSGGEEGPYERISSALIPGQGNSSMGASYEFTDQDVEAGCGYWYEVEEVSTRGESEFFGPVYVLVETGSAGTGTFGLLSNYPNPFNPSTTIRYCVSEAMVSKRVSLRIHNMTGQEIVVLVDREHDSGAYWMDWEGCDAGGTEVPSGVYICRLLADGEIVQTKRMVKIK